MLDSCSLAPLRRGVFEPLMYLINGSPRLRYWRELEKTQHLPEDELKERQWRRLIRMLRYAWENNAFYRARLEGAGVSPEMVLSHEDLRLIPILCKEEVRANTREMISQGFNMSELLHFKTGGSTGKSLDLYVTEECSELRNACARRHDRWTGWEPGEPIAAVWGNPCLPESAKEKLKHWLIEPIIYLDTMCVTQETVKSFVAEWNTVRPTLLFGHAHSIYILAKYIRDMSIADIRPRGILSTSMMLMPQERKVIEDVFSAKVTDRYGCEEVSLIGSECEKHEGMHLNIEHLFIEFIKDDGSCAAPGEPGRIIITDLMNQAMPFIRYQVEDMGVPCDRKCSCGRGLPLMSHVTGRVADFLIKRDGTKVAGVSLIENTLTKIPGIDQMQIIQESYDLILLRVVPATSFGDAAKRALSSYFLKLFGESVTIQVEIVASISPEASGKYRFSICKIPQV